MSDRQTCDGLGYCLKGFPAGAADLAAKDAEIARLREALEYIMADPPYAATQAYRDRIVTAREMARAALAAGEGGQPPHAGERG